MTVRTLTDADAWRALANVPDPELPMLSVVELGIVRSVAVTDVGVQVTITPTFTACPAMQIIEHDIIDALRSEGFAAATVHTVLAPAWTTDWMSDAARTKLKVHGIAPPGRRAGAADSSKPVACPRCDGADSERISEHGSTPCKARYRCRICLEPFERFKCV